MITSSYSRTWSPNEALQRAARQGKMDLLRTALRAGAGLDHISSQETTALMLASQEGHLSVVTYLLQQGAKIEVTLNTHEHSPPSPPTTAPSSPQTLQIIDMDEFPSPEDAAGGYVPEVKDTVTAVCLSAAVSSAKSGWPDILKLLVHTHHAHITHKHSPSQVRVWTATTTSQQIKRRLKRRNKSKPDK